MTRTAEQRNNLGSRVRDLAEHQAPNSFSLLIPTHRTHPETEQDPIRFKNAIDAVAGQLEAGGMRSTDVDELLASLRRHLDDRTFWAHRDLGLAVFGAPGTDPVELDLPVAPEQQIHVGDRFHIRPLVAGLDELGVPTLALSRGGVRLYEVDTRGAQRVECDLPASMTDVNWFVDRESRLQNRPQPPGGDGGGFHGHDPGDEDDEDLRRYLGAIVDVVQPRLRHRDVPLIVAAPDDLAGHLSNMLQHDVVPHPAIDPEDEHAVGRSVADARSDVLGRRRGKLRADLSGALGRGEVISDLSEALRGGAAGRLATLGITPDGAPVWGRFDESTMDVSIHDDRQAGDEDLADRLVALTLTRGGDVHPISEPIDGHWFVAVSRYESPNG